MNEFEKVLVCTAIHFIAYRIFQLVPLPKQWEGHRLRISNNVIHSLSATSVAMLIIYLVYINSQVLEHYGRWVIYMQAGFHIFDMITYGPCGLLSKDVLAHHAVVVLTSFLFLIASIPTKYTLTGMLLTNLTAPLQDS